MNGPATARATGAPDIERVTTRTVRKDGRELVAFAGCDYLGLARHPEVIAALQDAAAEYGVSCGASRRTSGTHPEHAALEHELADFLAVDDCALLPSGWHANHAAAEALAPDADLALLQAESHVSLREPFQALARRSTTFAGVDEAMEALAAAGDVRVVVAVEGLGPAGRTAPLDAWTPRQRGRRTQLVIDDGHGVGVLGEGGRGVLGALDPTGIDVLITGTLAKALGTHGGFAAGSASDVATIRERSRSYSGSTPIPPAVASAARTSLRIVRDEPSPLTRLRERVRQLREHGARIGLPTPAPDVPIFAFTAVDEAAVTTALDRADLFVPCIDYPGGPGPRWFRLALSADHTAEDVDRVAEVLESLGASLRGAPAC